MKFFLFKYISPQSLRWTLSGQNIKNIKLMFLKCENKMLDQIITHKKFTSILLLTNEL